LTSPPDPNILVRPETAPSHSNTNRDSTLLNRIFGLVVARLMRMFCPICVSEVTFAFGWLDPRRRNALRIDSPLSECRADATPSF
jgi:hypothetical protein